MDGAPLEDRRQGKPPVKQPFNLAHQAYSQQGMATQREKVVVDSHAL
jgi:hypothetical protein